MVKRKKGVLICFTGIDGSGKTTLAKKITAYLKEKGLSAMYVYGRLKPFLTKPLMIIGNKLFLKNQSIAENYIKYSDKKRTLFNEHKFLQKVYLYTILFDYILQVVIKVKIPLMLGKVIICDRYIYDTVITDIAIDMNFSEEQVVSLLDKCFLLIPKPDVTFVVDVNENVAYARKKDVSDERYLKDRRPLYLHITNNYKMSIIDGNSKVDEVFTGCVRRLDDELNL